MKQIQFLSRSVRFLLCLSLLLVSSCLVEKESWGIDSEENSGEITVTFDVKLPASIQQLTRAVQTAEEAEVKNVYVLIFENDGSYVGRKIVTESNLTTETDPELITFTVSLPVSASTANDDKYDIVLLANMSDTGAGSLVSQINVQISARSDKETFLKRLTYSCTGNPEAPFPMASLMKEPQTIDINTDFTGENRFEMIRMISRIDMGFDASYAGYTIEEVHLYNYNQHGLVWHNSGDSPATVTLPSTPDKAEDISYSVTNTASDKTSFSEQLYALEAQIEEADATRPCLVVRLTDGTEDLGWYRIDFVKSDGTWLDLVRNYRYIFTITGVKGNGYEDPDTAYKSKSTDIEAEIVDWSDAGVDEVVTDGQYILGVAPVEMELEADVSAGHSITVKTTAPAWRYYLSDNADSEEVLVSKPDWITFSGYTEGAEIAGGNSNPGYTLTFSVTENTSTDRTAYVHITTGKMTILVTILQQAPIGVRTLNVSGPSSDYPYTGDTQDYYIESYSTASDGSRAPVAWTAEFSTDGGLTWTTTAPDWLTAFTANGTGGSGSTYVATVKAFSAISDSPEDATLRSATFQGSLSSPYDLSTKGGGSLVNTANCYIVNGPGYYKLPLVYGNAIKNGADNPSAYNTSETGTTVLNQFLRHDDLPITGPYIYEQASPAGASLVWMDQPNLIAEVDLTDNGRSLYFYIKQEDIMQGNAVVAVHDAKGTILWSWHIWVTPLVNNVRSSDVTIVNVFGQTYNLMEYNLGWCAKRTIRYGEAPRSVQVRVSQTGIVMPQSATFSITQTHHEESLQSYSPHWQGRHKDPMQKYQTVYGTEFKMYDYAVSIGEAIQNPHIYYYDNNFVAATNSWCKESYTNLWGGSDL